MNQSEKIELMNKALKAGLFVKLSTECVSHLVTLVDEIPNGVNPKAVLRLLVKEGDSLKPCVILVDELDLVELEATNESVPESAESLRQSVRADRLRWNPLPLPRPIAQFVNPDVFA